MKILFLMALFLGTLFSQEINLGKWDKNSFNSFLNLVYSLDEEKKLLNISNEFLEVKYVANVLIGSLGKKEQLVIDLSKLDCFTFIDYIESMKNSNDFEMFKKQLINLRYKNSIISFKNRNHFFTDWIEENSFSNITSKLSTKTIKVKKYLNRKDSENFYLDGIDIKEREIEYLQSKFLDKNILTKLITGDYIGIYSNKKGLDVSHTGVIIKKDSKVYFRHASSKKNSRKVVDELFLDYIKKTPGFIVLRK